MGKLKKPTHIQSVSTKEETYIGEAKNWHKLTHPQAPW
jgi:hypothetical protein